MQSSDYPFNFAGQLMAFTRYKEDQIPVLIFFSLFALDLLVFFYVSSPWLLGLWGLLTIIPKGLICAWNHHHQHVAMFRNLIMNRLLEIVFFFQTAMATNTWTLHHVLGHHLNYLDQSKDESRWMRHDGSTMNVIEYTLATALTGYPRAIRVGMRHPKILRPMLQMTAVCLVLLALLIYYNWLAALLVFVIPMIGSYVITCLHTFFHHAGLDSDDHHEASYNIMHRWYNILTGNLGYHTAHHMKQGLHWSKLPEYHKSVGNKIPEHLYRTPGSFLKYLPAD